LGPFAAADASLIVVPQAIRLVLPPLGNLYSAMLKNSAILSSIGRSDLMFQATSSTTAHSRRFESFTASWFFLILTLPMGWFVPLVEKEI